MLLPIIGANPAEFIFTLLTTHVVTPLILLNSAPAFRTRFGIRQDPIRRFALILTFFLPDLQRSAIQGLMGFISAFDTKFRQARIAISNDIIRITKDPR
jgi:hypothetical protein